MEDKGIIDMLQLLRRTALFKKIVHIPFIPSVDFANRFARLNPDRLVKTG